MKTALLALTISACTPAPAASPVHVHDGDTLTVGGTRWRLHGVDAFELAQTCGNEPCGLYARDHLNEAVAGKAVVCTVTGKPSYGRQVGRCMSDGVDIAAEQVGAGWALDWAQYSGGAYRPLESNARYDRLGAWQWGFEAPWEWRRTHRPGPHPR